jgi:hypothetical protein
MAISKRKGTMKHSILSVLIFSFSFFPTTSQAQQQPQSEAQPDTVQKPRVFITDSQSWEVRGAAGGTSDAFAASSNGGARPQTAEIIKTFGERCPNVTVNNKVDLADYVVVLDHEGGKSLLQHRNKVAVFEHLSGDVVISHSTMSLGGSVEDACKGITAHWAGHSAELIAAKQKAHTPIAAMQLAATSAPQPLVGASIAIDSTPSTADIEVDGNFVGNTPSTITLPSGSHQVVVKKKGFADWTKTLNVTGGNIHLSAELEAQTPAQ